MMWSAADRLRDDMNDTHDAWIQDSVQHQMNGQDPNAWLHERLGEPSSSSVTNSFDQQTFNVPNGFDQHATQQQSFFSTFQSDPINQNQRLPARPQLGHQAGSFDGSSSYPLTTESVTSSNGPPSASINNSSFYANPYQPSHTPSTFPYTPSHSPPTETQRQSYQPQVTYMSSWSPLSGATNTPPIPPSHETHQQITIDPQLVTLPSSQAQPSRDSVNASYLQTQPRSYPTTVTPSSLHNAITPTPYYSTSVVPPPTRQKTQVPAQLQPSRPASAQSTRSTSSSGSVSTPSSRHPESHLRNLLSANAFESSPAGAARSLINALKTMGISDVSSALRKDILNTMRDNAGKDFFEAWAKSAEGMETFRIWLKSAVTRKDDGKREADETLMPLLNVIDRLPLGIEELRAAKIGKLVKNIVTDPPSSAAKDLATILTQKWTKLINQEQKRTEEDAGSSSDPVKKRKATEAPAPKIPPAKKASTVAGPGATTVAVKKEAVSKGETSTVKTTKSDSSFFSAPKKKSLPNFTKKTPAKKGDKVAQPSNFDPFQEAYNAMTGGSANPTTTTTATSAVVAADTPTNGMIIDAPKKLTDPLKRKKSVSFAPDAELEAIRWITRAEYPEDDNPHPHWLGDAKALDRDEGRALHAQILQEVIDWYDPPEILVPSDIPIEPRGGESVEAGIQAEREKTALIASYISHSHVPESAGDLHSRLGEPLQSDTPTVQMLPGAEIAEIIASNDAATQVPSSLSDLLAQIATPTQPKATTETWGQQSQQPSSVQLSILQSLGLKSAADIAALLSSVPPDALAMLQQQQQQQPQQQPPPLAQPPYSGENGYGVSQQSYASEDQQQGYWNDGGSSGSGGQWNGSRDDWDDAGYRGRGRGFGRGRGRGRGHGSRKLCNFWAKGYCRFGEACDFWHDPSLASLQTRKR